MTTGDEYRKRIAAASKTARARLVAGDRRGVEKRIVALTDMAANEDWLDGKTTPHGAGKPRRR